MKIDDKMIQYEISQNLPKSISNESGRIDERRAADGSKTEGKEHVGPNTTVEFSKASKEAQRIHDVISATPDVREDKVNELKAKIESGNYRIDHDAVAGKIIDDVLEEIL